MDAAIAEQRDRLAFFVIDSWKAKEGLGQLQWWGDVYVREPVLNDEPVPSIDTEPEREIVRVRAMLLEGRGVIYGILYRRLAALLLDRRVFQELWVEVSYLTSIEPKLRLDRFDVYDAVAEAYLRRLAEHEFTNWPPNAEAAIGPIIVLPSATERCPSPATVAAKIAHQGL